MSRRDLEFLFLDLGNKESITFFLKKYSNEQKKLEKNQNTDDS